MGEHSITDAARFDGPHGQAPDARYRDYFDCFNCQQYFEAHDALEVLWQAQREQANGAFYKGLIQLAGAFVHLQKNRLRPAAALFKLAETNLGKYPAVHEDLHVAGVRQLIQHWLGQLDAAQFQLNPLTPHTAPKLNLLTPPPARVEEQ